MNNITEKQQRRKPDAAIQYILTRAGIAYDFYVTDVVNPGRHCSEVATPSFTKKAPLDEAVQFRGGAFLCSSL